MSNNTTNKSASFERWDQLSLDLSNPVDIFSEKQRSLEPSQVSLITLDEAYAMIRESLEQKLQRLDVFTTPEATKRYCVVQLARYQQEVFAALFLDNRHRLIAYEKMFYGTIDGCSVYVREVVKRALANNAAALILSHNHPSGVAEPSQADRQITQRLKDAMALIDVRVLDHIVVGGAETVSFAERGLL